MSDSMFGWNIPADFEGGVLETPLPYEGGVLETPLPYDGADFEGGVFETRLPYDGTVFETPLSFEGGVFEGGVFETPLPYDGADFEGGVFETPLPYDGGVGVFPDIGPSGSNTVFQPSCSSHLGQGYLEDMSQVMPNVERNPTTPLPLPTTTKSNNGKSKVDELEIPSCPSKIVAGTSAGPTKKKRPKAKRSRFTRQREISKEKVRRRLITSKVKALHSLVPNARETDRIGVLAEIIAYIKRLEWEFQVLYLYQMLSTAGGDQQEAPYILPSNIQTPQIPSYVVMGLLLHAGMGGMCQLPSYPPMPVPMASPHPELLEASPRMPQVSPSVLVPHIQSPEFFQTTGTSEALP